MWLRRRVEIYNPKDDLTAIIQRLMSMDEKLDELLSPAEEDEVTKKKRYSDDPELAAAFEENERWMIERVKRGYRDRLEREAREERRRARLRRLTFGLLGR